MTIPPVLVRARSYWRELLIALLLLAIVIGSVATCQYRKKGVSEQSQKTIDSLAATQPAFDSTQLVSRRTEATHVATALTHQTTVTRATSAANRERISADSLARVAITAVNDAIKWRDAYFARTREADSLRVALGAATGRADEERAARMEADRRASLDSSRNVALQKLALGLERDANKAANCRVALVLPCITRTQAFVGGAVLGAVGAVAVTSRRR